MNSPRGYPAANVSRGGPGIMVGVVMTGVHANRNKKTEKKVRTQKTRMVKTPVEQP